MNSHKNVPIPNPIPFAARAFVEDSKSPTMRLVVVLETIGRLGPITLRDLTSETGISRAAVWRAAAVLRKCGWVNTRLSDHAFELSSTLESFAAKAFFTPVEVEEARKCLSFFQDFFHVNLGFFTAVGTYKILDSSRNDLEVNSELSLINDAPAIAALIPLPPTESEKHLQAYLNRSTKEERNTAEQIDVFAALEEHKDTYRVWSANGESFSAPFESSFGAYGSLEFSLKTYTQRQKQALVRLSECLPRVVDLKSALENCHFKDALCIHCRNTIQQHSPHCKITASGP
ncbi:hypothetical protein [Roseovarius sp. EL26]|uniref:hypothetical protein n=1 Tax=Roseovarius sp. EL26 TaxID=2126672 RepID=UPI000EA338EB|nr:hypothetical protein [Roseovarius sp. EL26]